MSLGDHICWKDQFIHRHIGPNQADKINMLHHLGLHDVETLIDKSVPHNIRLKESLKEKKALGEQEALKLLRTIAEKNKVYKSWIGMGYSNCVTPAVIQRNLLENPGWYTQYTPYQPEISQGRLQSLLNFQTMISDITGLPVANASLLDEATAAAEAMALSHGVKNKDGSKAFFISDLCHPQVIEVVKGRAEAWGINVILGDYEKFQFDTAVFGILLSYPNTDGSIHDFQNLIAEAHKHDALVTLSCDLLSLCLLKAPGEIGADIAVGNSQRFGVPLGFGGPHAGFFATIEALKRKVPGRIVGISKDVHGDSAYRLALQTREQHIRREKATSNICTAQALLANMAAMYAVYHGYEGLCGIANRVHAHTVLLAEGLKRLGYTLKSDGYFDCIFLPLNQEEMNFVRTSAETVGVNFRYEAGRGIGIALDETSQTGDIEQIWAIFSERKKSQKLLSASELIKESSSKIPKNLVRTSKFLEHENFKSYHTETELMRYMKTLEQRDISLTNGMIPLGSCTMKLNAAAELYPISWPEFAQIHPFAPSDQTLGYEHLCKELEDMLAEVTGYDAVSLQPNSGAQGEYAGLLVIKAYHRERKECHRNICLIPTSAHGTNPASAALAGYKVVPVACDREGSIDMIELRQKVQEHREHLAAIMVTYPSTHGVFEADIEEVCEIVHKNGGQVYLDGANLNAQLGLCAPGEFGADVSHLNLHKTFAIPHGGGGPGMGPIAVKAHLEPFLPSHPMRQTGGEKGISAISAAPFGSAGILPISWMYMRLLGSQGLEEATKTAILSANYIAKKLSSGYEILFKGEHGLVAHECIVDLRPFRQSAGIEVVDVAKRLMDYGFHAPTMAFPVPGTLMIEPTESENLEELDRFCEAMLGIRQEIQNIIDGKWSKLSNPLKNAPHTIKILGQEEWDFPYSREEAVFPMKQEKKNKFWPFVGRIDEVYGDRNLVCSCV